MSALTLTLIHRPEQRVDMSPLVCHKLSGLTPVEIAALELQSGKRKLRVDELFAVSGFDTAQIIIKKNSSHKLDYIGKELDGGEIQV
ncbi:formylmethanofuran dehydrogenase, partial [Methylocucumis oryzae]